ncbi:PREDICTED: sodium-independent sulfate anion transporter-like isoform X2 [Nicrophorus vespilloides]|uniref:Sodium-independent sulfate anion transporter-like isoform X2 n=1 Tax=Nicrophorus vespilloides TaxID=110193 RepID=A0ABM1NE13_NICVS|nr:PREDICTED: sodium-independent sulfate anion transporter-like isoform X2 [Nicrophorus vespilloides]
MYSALGGSSLSNNSSVRLKRIEAKDCKRFTKKRIPIIDWLPKYSISKCLHDILAGFTVGLTEVPQGIAYATVAGLPPEYGLYSGFMGCFMYTVFGSCKDINIGPTAIMALMSQAYIAKMGPDVAVLLTFLSGCIIFILGLLHLGFVVEFFSYPVVAGFTCAAALQIAFSQLKSLLGISGKANEFLESIITVIEHIKETKKWDVILGVICIIILMVMRELKRLSNTNESSSRIRKYFGKCMWFLSLARNALIVIITTVIAYYLEEEGRNPFTLIGEIGSGLPNFEPPPFSSTVNGTHYNFGEIIKEFGGGVAFVPLVAILETVAIAKAFSKGKTLDATQEMIALGICNIMGSFVRSMPVTGSFTRTAVNNSSGVKTQLGGIITAAMVLLALAFLTKTFTYIPKTTLAAVVITSMFYLFEFEAFILLWRSKKLDLIPFGVTLIASLFLGLEYGIILGIVLHLIYVLYPVARPKMDIINVKIPQGDVLVVIPNTNMQFPVAEFFKEKIISEANIAQCTVVIDGSKITYIDSTVAKNIDSLISDMQLRDQDIILWNFKSEIMDICIGVNKKMQPYFRSGTIEEVVDDPTMQCVQTDKNYSIQ